MSQPSSPSSPARLHALDAVRGLALILGIFFHASMSYYPGDPMWIIMDTQRSEALFGTGFVLHIFRMTTFFLLAGFFGRMVYHRMGAGRFALSRLKRIGIPLVVFWPMMMAAFTAIIIWSIAAQYGAAALEGAPPPPPLTAETFPLTHLWFLYVLLMFYAAMIVARPLIALLDFGGAGRKLIDRFISATLETPFLPALLAIPAAAAFLTHTGWLEWLGVPTPDTGIVPNTTALIAYGTAFLFGWALQRQGENVMRIQTLWPLHLVLAGAFTAVCWYLIGGHTQMTPALEGSDKTVYACAYAVAMWFWTFGLIGAALKFFSGESKMRRYLADSSYWLYIIHLPIVIALQVWTFKWGWPAEAKYAFILGLSIPLMLLSYHVLVRYSFIGGVLNGKRQPRKSKQTPEREHDEAKQYRSGSRRSRLHQIGR
mgnify:CR=1 FL=1